MSRTAQLRVAAVLAGWTLAATAATAQEKPKAPASMSAEEQAMMQKWHAFMTPGEPHQRLAAKVGTWTNKVTMWQAPGAPPATSEGTSEFKMILDGRYLQDATQGSFMGMPFQGQGLTAYDNIKKKYVSTWIDNMGTGIMTAEGDFDPATKTFTYLGAGPDVMSGKYIPMKSVEKIDGPDQWVMTMYSKTPDGKDWWKTMEVVYTRKQ